MLATIWYAFLAALGSSSAEGALLRLKTKAAVWREWKQCRGRYGLKPIIGDISNFLETTFEMTDWGSDFDANARLSKEQLDELFDVIGTRLIASGAVTFNTKTVD